MPNKDFLENTPLYKKYKVAVPPYLDDFPSPAINMECPNCKSIQTLNMVGRYLEYPTERGNEKSSAGLNINLKYICASCKSFSRQFSIHISENLDYFCKFGQYPEFDISINEKHKIFLKKHSENIKKGLMCENNNFGIGAFAYYRRIVEEIIDELLDSIFELIELKDKEKYEIALIETKNTRITQDKINLVKDLLPTSLRPDGYNPLGILHSALSEGLHCQTDEECLENAIQIREVLYFLIESIDSLKNSKKSFTDSMRVLLNKKIK